MKAIVMTEEYWANSQFSIARYYGSINVDGHRYIIVDKKGRDVYEASAAAKREGRDKAIPPGDPADLIRSDFQSLYKKLGRETFLRTVRDHPEIENPKQMREILK